MRNLNDAESCRTNDGQNKKFKNEPKVKMGKRTRLPISED